MIVLAAVLIGWIALRIAIVGVVAANAGMEKAKSAAFCIVPACRAASIATAPATLPAAQAGAWPVLRGAFRRSKIGVAAAKTWPPNAKIAPSARWLLGSPPTEGEGQGGVMLASELPERQPFSLLPATASPIESTNMALAAPRRARWSADGWMLLRPSGGSPALAAMPAAYGSSQFGAVIRYDLKPESAVRSQLYLRATGAIGASIQDRQAALGAALRPFPKIPVVGLIEGRVQQGSDTLRLRPAAAVVSELAPFRLPFDAVGEVYGQAGFVGGRDAAGFFDAQATATRAVLNLGSEAELDIGAGLWTGGQRGAARLDMGPRAVLRARLGNLPVRAALDWRERMAGNASPGSGPVLTLSAGF